MQHIPLHLCFKGERDYLHGTDFFNSIISCIADEYGSDIKSIQLAMHSFAINQCNLYFSPGKSEVNPPKGVKADFSFLHCGNRVSGWLQESDRTVDCRIPFDEQSIINSSTYSDHKISISCDTGFTIIENIVALTKELHKLSIESENGKWVFSKISVNGMLIDETSSNISLSLKSNLHNRITKTEINIDNSSVGFIFFSLIK